jgi:hypothetical protein
MVLVVDVVAVAELVVVVVIVAEVDEVVVVVVVQMSAKPPIYVPTGISKPYRSTTAIMNPSEPVGMSTMLSVTVCRFALHPHVEIGTLVVTVIVVTALPNFVMFESAKYTLYALMYVSSITPSIWLGPKENDPVYLPSIRSVSTGIVEPPQALHKTRGW